MTVTTGVRTGRAQEASVVESGGFDDLGSLSTGDGLVGHSEVEIAIFPTSGDTTEDTDTDVNTKN